jgi:hypothetical protein
MKFSIARLCGGKALMVSPDEDLGIDMERAADVLSSIGEMKENDDMMMVVSWNGMEITVYPQGKIMFYPLSDRETAVKYASDILAMLPRSA